MAEIWEFVRRHGYFLVFAAVFVEQAGAPIPAVPILLAMGAFAGLGDYSFSGALAAASIGALLADWVWFELGRRKGEPVLDLLCRFALEPDTCVTTTTRSFEKYGAMTLLFAKFVPGLNTVAPPLAGLSKMRLLGYVVYDLGGALVWSGAFLGLGYVFRGQVEAVADFIAETGGKVIVFLGVPLALYLAFKYVHRRRKLRLLSVERISPDELFEWMKSGEPLTVIDLRARVKVIRSGRIIEGARVMHPADAKEHLRDTPRGHHLVFYCG